MIEFASSRNVGPVQTGSGSACELLLLVGCWHACRLLFRAYTARGPAAVKYAAKSVGNQKKESRPLSVSILLRVGIRPLP